MQIVKGHITVGGLHIHIFTCGNIGGVRGDGFCLHIDTAACGYAIVKGVNDLFAALVMADAGGHVDIALGCRHINVAIGFDRRAVIVDISAGAAHVNVAARGYTGIHTVADVIDIAIGDQRHITAGRDGTIGIVDGIGVHIHVAACVNGGCTAVHLSGFHLVQRFRTQVNDWYQNVHAVHVLVDVPDDVGIQVVALLISERLAYNKTQFAVFGRYAGVIHQILYQRVAFQTVTDGEEATDRAGDLTADQFGGEVVIPDYVNRLLRIITHLVEEIVGSGIATLIYHRRTRFKNWDDVIVWTRIRCAVLSCFRSFLKVRGDFKHAWNGNHILDGWQWADPHSQLINLLRVDLHIITGNNCIHGVITHVNIADVTVTLNYACIGDAVIDRAAVLGKFTARSNFAFFFRHKIRFIIF